MSTSMSGCWSTGTSRFKDSLYVKQKHWFYRQGITPEWIYGVMSRLGPGQPPGQPVPGQARQPAGSPGRVGFPVAAAHRLVADTGLRAGQLRPDLPEPQGASTAWLRRPRGRTSAARRPKGRATDDPSSRDGRTAGRACLRARRALPRPARPSCARLDGGAHGLAIPHDRPARLHDQQGDLAGVRPDRRPSDGRHPDRRGPAFRTGAAPPTRTCSTSLRRFSTCWEFPFPPIWTAGC